MGELETVIVGDLLLQHLPVASVPIPALDDAGDKRPELILGYSLFEAMAVRIDRMTLGDVPEVMAIERESFTAPWPASAYRRELIENRMAHYFVLRLTPPPQVQGSSCPLKIIMVAAEPQPDFERLRDERFAERGRDGLGARVRLELFHRLADVGADGQR